MYRGVKRCASIVLNQPLLPQRDALPLHAKTPPSLDIDRVFVCAGPTQKADPPGHRKNRDLSLDEELSSFFSSFNSSKP